MGCLKLKNIDTFYTPRMLVQRPSRIVKIFKVDSYVSNNPINRIDPDGNSDFGVNDWIKFANGSVGFDPAVKAQAGQTVSSNGQQGVSLGASAVLTNSAGNTVSLNSDGTATNAVPLNEVTVTSKSSSSTLGNLTDAIGLSNDANAGVMAGVQMLDKTGDAAEGFATVGKALDVIGKATGIVSVIGSGSEFVQNPTVGNFLKLGTDVALVAFKVNPIVAVADGLLSVTGVKDAAFKAIDNKIDTYKLNQAINNTRVNTTNVKLR